MPGEHEIDNRPGFRIEDSGGNFQLKTPDGKNATNAAYRSYIRN